LHVRFVPIADWIFTTFMVPLEIVGILATAV